MNITVRIDAPELAGAIQALASALSATKGSIDVPKTQPKQEVKQETPKQEASKEEPKPEQAPQAEETSSAGEDKPSITLETVRGKLAALSQSGKQAEVKELISSFGVKKLTAIPEEKYAELLEKAEAL